MSEAPERIPVSDEEMAHIISECMSPKSAHFGFGPSGAWLHVIDDNQHAMQVLLDYRTKNIEEKELEHMRNFQF